MNVQSCVPIGARGRHTIACKVHTIDRTFKILVDHKAAAVDSDQTDSCLASSEGGWDMTLSSKVTPPGYARPTLIP
jgi:hypothetical protein